jgi:hypothetical protein
MTIYYVKLDNIVSYRQEKPGYKRIIAQSGLEAKEKALLLFECQETPEIEMQLWSTHRILHNIPFRVDNLPQIPPEHEFLILRAVHRPTIYSSSS